MKLELQECLEPVAAAVDNCLIDFGKSDLEVQRTGVIQGAEFLCANVAKLEGTVNIHKLTRWQLIISLFYHFRTYVEGICHLYVSWQSEH